ncbi:hypothetical protein J437_LFUL004549 [Ladona fulva]|uniref:Uncharacterized protein n=1 Tax=Ladona fulva TaxID=123851 RepID=A0A8K0NUL5_LADFU|nr:hypothetical protein J437_LFUL004549 [Ladona fulva]
MLLAFTKSAMNAEQHALQQPSNDTTEEDSVRQRTESATDLRVGSAMALSNVAKYWVLTNLFPGPVPQVPVYGTPRGVDFLLPPQATKAGDVRDQQQLHHHQEASLPHHHRHHHLAQGATMALVQSPQQQIPTTEGGANLPGAGPPTPHLEVPVVVDTKVDGRMDKSTCTNERPPGPGGGGLLPPFNSVSTPEHMPC